MSKTHDATFYVQIERKKRPQYRTGKGYVSASAVKITQDPPTSLAKDTVSVKLTVQLPDAAFDPITPSAVVTVPDSLVQHPLHIIVEDAT